MPTDSELKVNVMVLDKGFQSEVPPAGTGPKLTKLKFFGSVSVTVTKLAGPAVTFKVMV